MIGNRTASYENVYLPECSKSQLRVIPREYNNGSIAGPPPLSSSYMSYNRKYRHPGIQALQKRDTESDKYPQPHTRQRWGGRRHSLLTHNGGSTYFSPDGIVFIFSIFKKKIVLVVGLIKLPGNYRCGKAAKRKFQEER